MVAACQLPSSPIHAQALVNASKSVRVQAAAGWAGGSSPERLANSSDCTLSMACPIRVVRRVPPASTSTRNSADISSPMSPVLAGARSASSASRRIGRAACSVAATARALAVDQVLALGDPAAQHGLPAGAGLAVDPVRVDLGAGAGEDEEVGREHECRLLRPPGRDTGDRLCAPVSTAIASLHSAAVSVSGGGEPAELPQVEEAGAGQPGRLRARR